MKSALRLAIKLEPFIKGECNRCMSEIDGLLIEIHEYLSQQAGEETTWVDPTLESQLPLPLSKESEDE